MIFDWRKEVGKFFPQARFDEPLSRHTTFKIGGPADCYVEIETRLELEKLARLSRKLRVPIFFIGWGSNLLVLDGGVRGLVARLTGDFDRIDFLEGGLLRAGAAVRLPKLIVSAAKKGLGGAEALVGIPGTVGGALIMNAGTRDLEIGSLAREVEILDSKTLETRVIKPARLHFSYRSSNLEGRIILSTILQLKLGNKSDIMKRIAAHQEKRLKTQPVHSFNVGSVFKNPTGYFAAKLIENCGLKGFVSGGARVSALHANFIENFAGAKASDVLDLARKIRAKVERDLGVALELEMKTVGRP